MKKIHLPAQHNESEKKGYNEKNPTQPEGAFSPASGKQPVKQRDAKSNSADKKRKKMKIENGKSYQNNSEHILNRTDDSKTK